uniref:Tryptophan synthase alpha chain n=1 Tax=Chondria tumulosa TaxID=2740715 RepID=A0A896SSX9_9FLOR|nr:tryptophan synthase alpha subunit [Chondria tumulosa]QSD57053.1 tryptophan synthase alpha subunit [Chondria tumulosa]
MNSISKILENKRSNSTCALIPFITAGYPNIDTTLEALYILDKQGADIIELGIPYSDALADGPTIQKSSKIALEQGVYIDQVLQLLDQVQFTLNVPIVIFTYYNPILVRGISKFLEEISMRGVKGLIVPDLPIEETDYLIHLCSQYNIELILFIAPTSSKNRIINILNKAPGCVYLVSTTGVTGMRKGINRDINNLSAYIKSNTNKFLMLGFGISTAEQVAQISSWDIDGIVVGSACIRILSSNPDNNIALNSLGLFCNSMKAAIK